MSRKDLMTCSDLNGGTLLPQLSRFSNIVNEMDRFFNRVLRSFDMDVEAFSTLQPKSSFPKVNVSETDEHYKVEVALAGFKKEDINLEFKENSILIMADKLQELSSDEDGSKYLVKEISGRSFRRVINFVEPIEKSTIECKYHDGIVTCLLKKKEALPKEDSIKIEIL